MISATMNKTKVTAAMVEITIPMVESNMVSSLFFPPVFCLFGDCPPTLTNDGCEVVDVFGLNGDPPLLSPLLKWLKSIGSIILEKNNEEMVTQSGIRDIGQMLNNRRIFFYFRFHFISFYF